MRYQSIEVKVTSEHIKRAGCGSRDCVMAQALMDHFKVNYVSCGRTIALVYQDGYGSFIQVALDEDASLITRKFDTKQPIEPQTVHVTQIS